MDAKPEQTVAECGFVPRDRGEAEGSRQRNIVFKFGGTSLAGAERMLHAARLVRDAAGQAPLTVVVSAMRGVTDRLLRIAQALAAGDLRFARAEAEFVLHLHREVLHELQPEGENAAQTRCELVLLARDLLHEVPLQRRTGVGEALPELCDRLASFGERFSARLFAAALAKIGVPAIPVVSSDFVVTCGQFRNARPDLPQTRLRGRAVILPLLEAGIVPVVTGFLGAAPDGRITTLGRNSSDYSGAIIARVVDAEELVIWTDVDGVYTANPNASDNARLLSELTYDEACALAAAGARVLHASVLPLAAETQMIVWVRNTFKPHARGTRIGLPRDARAYAGVPAERGGAA